MSNCKIAVLDCPLRYKVAGLVHVAPAHDGNRRHTPAPATNIMSPKINALHEAPVLFYAKPTLLFLVGGMTKEVIGMLH